MEVTIQHLDRVKFAIRSRAHTILCDQPASNGGDDSAMTPAELFLASLGSWAAFSAVQYLRDHRLNEQGVEVAVSAERMMQPARLGRFRIRITHPSSLTESQADSLLHSLRQCLTNNALFSPQEVAIQLAPVASTAVLGRETRLLR